MTFSPPPSFAAWRHRGTRAGFEVLFLRTLPAGHRFEGHTSAVEAGEAWAVRYAIEVGDDWSTKTAHVVGSSARGRREVRLDADGVGGWLVDGTPAPSLHGCLDVDLESSSFTNALPVHRMRVGVGQAAEAPAVYVRAVGLGVERLEQRYRRIEDDGSRQRYEYSAPRFDYAGDLTYDSRGLLLDYPGIAERAA
jgi:uncharacterized protein